MLPFIYECRVKEFQDIIIKTVCSYKPVLIMAKLPALFKNTQESRTTIFMSAYKHIIIFGLSFKYRYLLLKFFKRHVLWKGEF